jgi:hypothetical protein
MKDFVIVGGDGGRFHINLNLVNYFKVMKNKLIISFADGESLIFRGEAKEEFLKQVAEPSEP